MTNAIAVLKDEAQTLVDRAEKFEVQTEENYQKGSKVVGYLTTKRKDVDALRRWFTDPLNAVIKEYNAFFKAITEPIKRADTIVREKMLVYHREQERIRAEEARKIEEDNRRRLEKAKKPERVKVKEAPPPVAKSTGPVTIRKRWTFEVINPKEVPPKFLLDPVLWIDKVGVQRAVDAGARNIPGFRIYQKESISSRSY